MTPPPRPTPTYVTRDEFEARISELKQVLQIIDGHILNVEELVNLQGEKMAADFDQLDADLNTLAAGYVALQAQNVALQSALDSADADRAAAVAAAVQADDADNQSKVDAADAIATAVLNPPAPSV